MKYYKNKKEGFSLLELILAIAIFSIGSVALATLLIDANLSTRLGGERTEALFYAKEGVEAVRSIRDNSWSDLTDGTYGLSNIDGAWALAADPDLIDNKYTRSVEINETATSTKSINISVVWNVNPGRTASTSLLTILTDWKQ
jgi:prepilin-type N-terminal cleavage/methylation domain-containing protein